jgi:hypothetical protein
MEYATPTKTLLHILVLDSQTIVPSSVSSAYSSPYVASLSSPSIHSSIVDLNTTTQAFNLLETFELVPTPPLPSTLPLSPILTEKYFNSNTNVISTNIQKNQ